MPLTLKWPIVRLLLNHPNIPPYSTSSYTQVNVYSFVTHFMCDFLMCYTKRPKGFRKIELNRVHSISSDRMQFPHAHTYLDSTLKIVSHSACVFSTTTHSSSSYTCFVSHMIEPLQSRSSLSRSECIRRKKNTPQSAWLVNNCNRSTITELLMVYVWPYSQRVTFCEALHGSWALSLKKI